MQTTTKLEKATLLIGGMFGYRQVQVRDLEVSLVCHAQFKSAVRYSYVARGKRKREGRVEGFKPTLVVLAGWHVMELASPMEATGPTSSATRYSACDAAWDVEFSDALKRSGLLGSLALDFRGHNSGSM